METVGGGILNLDVARVTGWAYGHIPSRPPPLPIEIGDGIFLEKPLSGQYEVAPEGCSAGKLLSNYWKWLGKKIISLRPSGIVYEAPFYNQQRTSFQTACKLVGQAGMTQAAAEYHGIRYCEKVQATSVKKRFVGKGHAEKDEIIAQCRLLGWEVSGEDEADALAIYWTAWFSLWEEVKERSEQRKQAV